MAVLTLPVNATGLASAQVRIELPLQLSDDEIAFTK
jgi:hypothetical protein